MLKWSKYWSRHFQLCCHLAVKVLKAIWKLYTYIFGIIIIASCNIVSIWWTPSTFRAPWGHRRGLHNHLWLHHNLRRRVLWRLLCDCGERQIWRDSSWILHFTTWPSRPHRQIAYLLLKLRWIFWWWGWDSFSVILRTYLKEHLKIAIITVNTMKII